MFQTLFYKPLYNLLIAIINFFPALEIGWVIVIFTVIVKILLLPLAIKATRTQLVLKKVEPELKQLREDYADDKQVQAAKMMELYQKHQVNPFSMIMLIIIQLPIIFALIFIIRDGLPDILVERLYGFSVTPEDMKMSFLWIKDLANRDVVIAALAGITQFFQMKITMGSVAASNKPLSEMTMQEQMMQSMTTNMKYVFPVLAGIFSYIYGAGLALYWLTSSAFAIVQELLVKRKIEQQFAAKEASALAVEVVADK